MQSKKTFNNLLIMLLISCTTASAQSINTATINVGGGTYARGYFQFDWSIGEGASIETFKSLNNYLLTTGVLQPFTEKNLTGAYTTYFWAKDEVTVFPIPTQRILEVDIKVTAEGVINMQLFDQLGKLVLANRFDYIITNRIQKLDLIGLAPGIYYLDITMGRPLSYPVMKKGTFKIQKL